MTQDFIIKVTRHSETKIKEYNEAQVEISIDEHISMLRDYREGQMTKL